MDRFRALLICILMSSTLLFKTEVGLSQIIIFLRA